MDFNSRLQSALDSLITIKEEFNERTFNNYLLKLLPDGWTIARLSYDPRPPKILGHGPMIYVSLLPPSHDRNQRVYALDYNITIDFGAKTIGFTGPNKLLIKQSYTDFDKTIAKLVKDISDLASGGTISISNDQGRIITLKDTKRDVAHPGLHVQTQIGNIGTIEIQSQTSVGMVTIGDVEKLESEWFYSFLIQVTDPVQIEGLDCYVAIFGQIGTDSIPEMDYVITRVEQYSGDFVIYDDPVNGSGARSSHDSNENIKQIQELAAEALHDEKIMNWIEQFHESFNDSLKE